jgi:hypothetical protein
MSILPHAPFPTGLPSTSTPRDAWLCCGQLVTGRADQANVRAENLRVAYNMDSEGTVTAGTGRIFVEIWIGSAFTGMAKKERQNNPSS